MGDKEIKIILTTAADMAGADAASAGLDKVTAKVAEHGDAEKEAAEHTENHAASSRELHRVFGELDRIVPGLGEAMHAAFHPDSIGIVGAIVAFEALKSILEQIKALEEVKLTNFTGDKDAVDAVRESYEKAAVAARTFVDEQNRLNSSGVTADEVARRQIENYKNLASAQADYNAAQKNLGQAEIEEAAKKGLITKQQEMDALFALDVEYARKKLQLEAQTDAEELAAKRKQLDTTRAQLGLALSDQQTDEANTAATAGAKARHDREIEIQKNNIDDAQKTLDELAKPKGSVVKGEISQDSIEQLERAYKKVIPEGQQKSDANHTDMFLALQDYLNKNNLLHGHFSNQDEKDARNLLTFTMGNQSADGIAKYDDAQNQLNNSKKQLDSLTQSQFQVDLNAERGKKQLEATDEAVRKLSESVEALAREIPQTQADNTARQNNNAAVENLNLRAQRVKQGMPDPGNPFRATAPVPSAADPGQANPTPWRYQYDSSPASGRQPAGAYQSIQNDVANQGRAAADINKVVDAGNIIHAGGQIDAGHTAILQEILTMQTGHQVTIDSILTAIKTVTASQAAKQAAIEREVQVLAAQNSNGYNTQTSG